MSRQVGIIERVMWTLVSALMTYVEYTPIGDLTVDLSDMEV